MKIKLILPLIAATFFMPVYAAAIMGDTHIIDIPTAEALPARTLSINARMFSRGGVLAYLEYGITNNLSVGASETMEHLIGSNDEDIKFLAPALQAKFRFYDGDGTLPALAAGFDNQGFLYNHGTREYSQKARGFYVLATKEAVIPGLVITPGLNVTVEGFEFDKLAAFAGAAFNIRDIAALMFEWDNIRSINESRLNCGLRLYLHESFSVDFALRDFSHKTERVAQLRYSFSI